MSSSARKNIFKRLNSAERADLPLSPEEKVNSKNISQIEKIETLKSLMEAVRAEVHVISSGHWIVTLIEILKRKGLKNLLYSSGTDMGKTLEERWGDSDGDLPELIPYSENIEQFKSWLFEIDASITTAKGAIADIGTILLLPDEKEPRTMSLVPPVHIAVLKKEKIYNNLSETILLEGWSKGMPTNALLISGPSKTADIELTLAYGVHGPKELILLIV